MVCIFTCAYSVEMYHVKLCKWTHEICSVRLAEGVEGLERCENEEGGEMKKRTIRKGMGLPLLNRLLNTICKRSC